MEWQRGWIRYDRAGSVGAVPLSSVTRLRNELRSLTWRKFGRLEPWRSSDMAHEVLVLQVVTDDVSKEENDRNAAG